MNKIINNKLVLVLVGICFPYVSMLHGQNPKEDLVKMNNIYINSKSYEINVELKCFKDFKDDSSEIAYKGYVKKDNKFYLSEMMGRITLVNNKWVLLIDDSLQTIFYNHPLKEDTLSKIALVDSSYFNSFSMSYFNSDKSKKHIRIRYVDPTIDSLDIEVNPNSFILEKIIYYYKPSEEILYNKIEILYTDTKINKVVKQSVFSEDNYISVKNDAVIPIGNRSKYKIINKQS